MYLLITTRRGHLSVDHHLTWPYICRSPTWRGHVSDDHLTDVTMYLSVTYPTWSCICWSPPDAAIFLLITTRRGHLSVDHHLTWPCIWWSPTWRDHVSVTYPTWSCVCWSPPDVAIYLLITTWRSHVSDDHLPDVTMYLLIPTWRGHVYVDHLPDVAMYLLIPTWRGHVSDDHLPDVTMYLLIPTWRGHVSMRSKMLVNLFYWCHQNLKWFGDCSRIYFSPYQLVGHHCPYEYSHLQASSLYKDECWVLVRWQVHYNSMNKSFSPKLRLDSVFE
jgi:hypothetical protein